MNLVATHAGDDSDGKIWGLEGTNILFILAGLVLSIGLLFLLHRQKAHFLFVAPVPFVVITAYVFALRQGKPKSFDTDLLETLVAGNGWTPPVHQPRNPLV